MLHSEQATYSTFPSIILLTEHLPWPITATVKLAFVTVYGVLQVLHPPLRLQITALERGSLSRATRDPTAASSCKRASFLTG